MPRTSSPESASGRHTLRIEPKPIGGRFEVLPKRWVVERTFAWLERYRRLTKDYERLPQTLAGLRFVAFACVVLGRLAMLTIGS